MSYISIKCKNCGSTMTMNVTSKTITCIHCGSTFLLSQLLDEKDLAFIEKIKPDDLSKKLEVSDNLKDGESCLFKGEYEKSEEYFKKAIELDEHNYKGYLGVVRAKTHNYNLLPNSDDYKEYARYALKYADGDDAIYVKNELEKIPILKAEKAQLMEAKAQKVASSSHKRISSHSLITKITCVVVALLMIGILIGIIIYRNQNDDKNPPASATIEIKTADEFYNLSTNPDSLSSTIVLKNDINFDGKSLISLGSAAKPFTGKFYGNGYTLSNFKLQSDAVEGDNYIGVFKYAKNATITGLNLSAVTFTENRSNTFYSNNIFGFICAYAENTNIKKCSVDNNCKFWQKQSRNQSYTVGGIVGYANDSQISMCYSNADITTEYLNVQLVYGYRSLYFYMGGIVGLLENSNVANSYSAGKISSSITSNITHEVKSYTAGISGQIVFDNEESYYVNNSFFAGTITSNITITNSQSAEPLQCLAAITNVVSLSNNLMLNLAYFKPGSFILNSASIEKTVLGDYTSNINSIEFIENENTLQTRISSLFSSKDWNLDSTYPTLK